MTYSSRRRERLWPIILATAALGAALIESGVAGAASNIGGGPVSGTAHFTQPIPPLGQGCAPTSFTFSGETDAFTLTTIDSDVISGYAGYLTFSGSGGSVCEGASQGAGTLTMSATGDGSVRCKTLTGTYNRLGTDVVVNASGDCRINNVPAQIAFTFRGEFVPTNSGGGTTAPITDAAFAGAVVVSPA